MLCLIGLYAMFGSVGISLAALPLGFGLTVGGLTTAFCGGAVVCGVASTIAALLGRSGLWGMEMRGSRCRSRDLCFHWLRTLCEGGILRGPTLRTLVIFSK